VAITEIDLIGTWSFVSDKDYAYCVVAIAFTVRLFMCILRAFSLPNAIRNLHFVKRAFKAHFWGRDDYFLDIRGDRWTSFILGLIELFIYPVLIALQAWPVIGAWLGLKTLSSWNRWANEPRLAYQHFLIGNVLILWTAWWLADHYVLLIH
jgi:hypothetical protein